MKKLKTLLLGMCLLCMVTSTNAQFTDTKSESPSWWDMMTKGKVVFYTASDGSVRWVLVMP